MFHVWSIPEIAKSWYNCSSRYTGASFCSSNSSGNSSDGLERALWEREVAGSSPVSPTSTKRPALAGFFVDLEEPGESILGSDGECETPVEHLPSACESSL